MTKFTKERLEQYIKSPLEHGLTRSEQMEMARHLLAWMEQEPVAYYFPGGEREIEQVSLSNDLDDDQKGNCIPLCAAPQCINSDSESTSLSNKNYPQPAVAERVPESLKLRLITIGDVVEDTNEYCQDIWNACRAAMLQGAEPVRQNNKLPFEQWLSQQPGTIDVECGCVMTEVFYHWLRVAYEAGNSRVIQDGWVTVPAEPTAEMIEATFAGEMELQSVQHQMRNRERRAHYYRAMIAAAPKQEVTTGNNAQQLESLCFFVTSDERKMEIPRCSKHPETELQVHPFEILLSYPPKPAMYCPLCRPSVAEWVEFDKKLRQWKEVK